MRIDDLLPTIAQYNIHVEYNYSNFGLFLSRIPAVDLGDVGKFSFDVCNCFRLPFIESKGVLQNA